MIDKIRDWLYMLMRNRKIRKAKRSEHLLCRMGIHAVNRSFGMANKERMAVCYRKGCNWSKWYKDKTLPTYLEHIKQS